MTPVGENSLPHRVQDTKGTRKRYWRGFVAFVPWSLCGERTIFKEAMNGI